MGLDHELSAEAKARIIQNETADNIEKEGVLGEIDNRRRRKINE